MTNLTIEFYNLTSVGSNFTNVNETYNARADFYGLDINLIIFNVNTSSNLFTSRTNNQSYNATFSPGQILMIVQAVVANGLCTSTERIFYPLILLFSILGILTFSVLSVMEIWEKGNLKRAFSFFVIVLILVIIIREIADSMALRCIL